MWPTRIQSETERQRPTDGVCVQQQVCWILESSLAAGRWHGKYSVTCIDSLGRSEQRVDCRPDLGPWPFGRSGGQEEGDVDVPSHPAPRPRFVPSVRLQVMRITVAYLYLYCTWPWRHTRTTRQDSTYVHALANCWLCGTTSCSGKGGGCQMWWVGW